MLGKGQACDKKVGKSSQTLLEMLENKWIVVGYYLHIRGRGEEELAMRLKSQVESAENAKGLTWVRARASLMVRLNHLPFL